MFSGVSSEAVTWALAEKTNLAEDKLKRQGAMQDYENTPLSTNTASSGNVAVLTMFSAIHSCFHGEGGEKSSG